MLCIAAAASAQQQQPYMQQLGLLLEKVVDCNMLMHATSGLT